MAGNEDLNPKDAVGRKKDPIHLVPTEAIRIASHAMRYGAYEAKRVDGTFGYGPFNWRETKVSYTIYLDAISRHNMKLQDGEDLDQDSLVHHLGHIIANAGIVLDAIKTGSLVDDRPKIKKTEELKGCIAVRDDERLLDCNEDSWACKVNQCFHKSVRS